MEVREARKPRSLTVLDAVLATGLEQMGLTETVEEPVHGPPRR